VNRGIGISKVNRQIRISKVNTQKTDRHFKGE